MSGQLNHSPADVVRRLLIDLLLGADPPGTASNWPVYVGSEPASPDNVITVYDTAGRLGPRSMVDGGRLEHNGVQIRVRSGTEREGWLKANAIAVSLDRDVEREAVVVGGSTYCVQAVTRTGDTIPLGKETPTSKRSLWTLNAVVALRMV